MVTVAVDARWGEDEPLEAGPVGRLDADAGVEAEPSAVIPRVHVLGVVRVQEAVACEMTKHSPSDGVLEALQEFVGEGCGLVEAEVGFWIGQVLIRVFLDPLEEPVHDAQMKMVPSGPWVSEQCGTGKVSARPSNEAKLSSMNWGLREEPKRWRKLTAPMEETNSPGPHCSSPAGTRTLIPTMGSTMNPGSDRIPPSSMAGVQAKFSSPIKLTEPRRAFAPRRIAIMAPRSHSLVAPSLRFWSTVRGPA